MQTKIMPSIVFITLRYFPYSCVWLRTGNLDTIVCHLLWWWFKGGIEWCAEKATAPHSSPLAWKIPWMEEPGGLQSMGSLRAGHD